MCVFLSVCEFPNKSKMAEPIKLKFCDKLSHFWVQVLVFFKKCIQKTFFPEIGSLLKIMRDINRKYTNIVFYANQILVLSIDLKGEFTVFFKFNTTLGHIYTSHFTIKTPSDRFRMAVMAQNVVLFCTLLGLHKEKFD